MLPKKLFCVDHQPADAVRSLQVRRAIVVAHTERDAISQLQACLAESLRKAKETGEPCPFFSRSKAAAIAISDAIKTTPPNVSYGVICVETTGAATADRRHRGLASRVAR